RSCMTPEEVKDVYGENLDKFLAIRQELDPKGTFKNEYLENLLSSSPASKVANVKRKKSGRIAVAELDEDED
ncbi:hypothetical protein HDV06_002903, partial [Boothiomyces sp. JEL0866]